MNNKKILLIGPLPPPSGGISIHINRLYELLKNDYTIEFIDEAGSVKADYFNIRSFNVLKYFKKVQQSNLVFIHSGSHLLRFFHLVAAWVMFKKSIVTIHAYPAVKKKTIRFFEEFFYAKATAIIAVNSSILTRITLPEKKCFIKNAFLPPVMETEPELPVVLKEWISAKKSKGKIIVCANAWQLELFNNEDLYGLDLCIEAADKLRKENPSIVFIFNVVSIDKFKEQYTKFSAQIKEKGLEEDFLLINEKLSFVKLIQLADIVLRPTNTDGDALTIREALFLGKPILASDVVERPSGTILFKSRDVGDMELKLKEIATADLNKINNSENETRDSFREFYKRVIDNTLQKN